MKNTILKWEILIRKQKEVRKLNKSVPKINPWGDSNQTITYLPQLAAN